MKGKVAEETIVEGPLVEKYLNEKTIVARTVNKKLEVN